MTKGLSLFRLGARAASRYRNGDETLYFCPICGRGFPIEAAIQRELTLEHVPTRRVGGKALLLTCANCNRGRGHTIDAAVARREDMSDFAKLVLGKLNRGSTPAMLKFGGQSLRVSLCRKNGTTEIRVVDKANHPETIEKLRKGMHCLTHNGRWDGFEFGLSKDVRLTQRHAKIGDLKCAFLLLFAWLGYRYAFDIRLESIRRQLLAPSENILSTIFWIALNEGGPPPHSILGVEEPVPYFFVVFNDYGVILPALESPQDLYKELAGIWEAGGKISVTAKPLVPWPEKMFMILDLR